MLSPRGPAAKLLRKRNIICKYRIPESRMKLERLGEDLTKTLDKIFKSEKVINSNMSDVGAQYRNKSEDYKKLSTHYNNLNVSIKEMNENYRVVSEKLETLNVQ
jgi:seryl-tRNA synthetase